VCAVERMQLKYLQGVSDAKWWCIHIHELTDVRVFPSPNLPRNYSLPAAVAVNAWASALTCIALAVWDAPSELHRHRRSASTTRG